MSHRIFGAALGAVLLLGSFIGCTEQVAGSLGCPQLCTDETSTLRDTTILDVVAIDTTFDGYPRLGEDRNVTLTSQADTADIRVVARFDSLPVNYRTLALADSLIRRVDSASVIFTIDTTTVKPTVPFTIDAYDVDTTATDTTLATILKLFRADRLIGSRTYEAADVKSDTVRLSLSNAALFAKVRDTLRLRIGLRVRGTGTAKVRILANNFIPRVRFRVSTDTLIAPDTVFPRSVSPPNDIIRQSELAFYPVIAAGKQPLPVKGLFTVGGLSGARTYLKFDIPARVIDSVTVVRASLLLTQRPSRGTARVANPVTVFVQPVLASPSLTDILTATTFLGAARSYGVDSVQFSPRDSGTKSIELVNLVRYWRGVGAVNTSRAIVLTSLEEGSNPGDATFFSTEAIASLRPRLRLTFVPRSGFGIP